MKQYIYCFILILVFISCGPDAVKNNLEIQTPIIYTIKNKELKEEIKKIIRTERIGTFPVNSIISLGIEYMPEQETTQYYISFIDIPFNLQMYNDIFFIDCDNIVIVGGYYKIGILDVSNGYIWSVLKNIFPQQYKLYEEGWEQAPNTGTIKYWTLTFKNGKCINKVFSEE